MLPSSSGDAGFGGKDGDCFGEAVFFSAGSFTQRSLRHRLVRSASRGIRLAHAWWLPNQRRDTSCLIAVGRVLLERVTRCGDDERCLR